MFLDIFGYVCVAQKPFSASKACNAKHRLIETKQSSVKESTIISHQGLLNELHRVESWNNIRNGKALLVLWVNHCDHLHSLVNSAIQACHTFSHLGKMLCFFSNRLEDLISKMRNVYYVGKWFTDFEVYLPRSFSDEHCCRASTFGAACRRASRRRLPTSCGVLHHMGHDTHNRLLETMIIGCL